MGASAVQQKEPLEVWRCPKCGRILGKVRLCSCCDCEIQIKCGCNNYAEKR